MQQCTDRIRNPPDQPVQIFLRMDELQCLLANAKLTDDVPITIGIVCLQIIQQAAALAHEHQQTAPGGMVFLMRLKMLGQLSDAFA